VKTPFPPFRVLLSNDQILRRSHELARRIRADHADEPPMLVAVIEGARPFARLLQQAIPGSLPVHEVRASSYVGTESSGQVTISVGRDLPVRGRSVLLLEDIVDTGRTIAALRQHYLAQGAKRVAVASLLSKPSRRVVEVEIEYLSFSIPDEFVLGFGMDLDGRYRELPDIVVYERAVEQAFAAS
jgi:hypoxanthine phosphoribosyltransferase